MTNASTKRDLVRFFRMQSSVSYHDQVMMCFRDIETFEDLSKPDLEPNVFVPITNTKADIWPLAFGVREFVDLSHPKPNYDLNW
jgi:hypothetical protein